MPFRPSLLGFIAATQLLVPVAARAADLDDSFSYAEAPADVPVAETKVEFGTGWYVRGDVAATETFGVVADRTSRDTEYLGIHRNHAPAYAFSLGGGYSFTNGFRTEILADIHQPTSSHYGDQLCISTPETTCEQFGKFRNYDALADIYYDFGTWYRLTPYVGAGAGVGFGNINARITLDPKGDYLASSSYQNFAFALMAGVAIDVLPHTKIDVGYRYLNSGRVAGTSVYYHEVRAGLRYMIDN